VNSPSLSINSFKPKKYTRDPRDPICGGDWGKQPIEVGLIGREGMTGRDMVVGGEKSANYVYAKRRTRPMRVPESLRGAIHALHWSLLRSVNSFLNQVTRPAVANGRNKIEKRLARWILMADDRLEVEELPLTQEFLALMLGVSGPGSQSTCKNWKVRAWSARQDCYR
jgi:CRP-like cAMP-binding protein